jgi:hypothetical protein
MTTLMEQQIEQQPRPCCTRQQAAAMLEELRAQYQQLSPCAQGAVKTYLSTESNQQFSLEGEE